MIITYSKHGRTARDSAKLIAHLLKPENDHIEILDIGNSVAADLPGGVRDMEILRNGSSAKASFHHLSINPSINYSKEQFLPAADALRAELDAGDTRPWIVIAHGKARQNSTEGYVHAHLVLGHVAAKPARRRSGTALICPTQSTTLTAHGLNQGRSILFRPSSKLADTTSSPARRKMSGSSLTVAET